MPLLHAPKDRHQLAPGSTPLLIESLGLEPEQARLLLDQVDLTGVFERHGIRFGELAGSVYTPELTLWAMTSQFFYAEAQRSCQAAVNRVMVLCGQKHDINLSSNTAAYCRARKKLKAEAVAEIAKNLADAAERIAVNGLGSVALLGAEAIEGDDLASLLARLRRAAKGRRIVLFDGLMAHAADTQANQEAWPQSGSQQEGLGFPVLREAVMTSLLTGAVIAAKLGPGKGKATGETAMLREMLDHLSPGDVLVADSYHCSYWILAECTKRGVFLVARNNASRAEDPRRSVPLVEGDLTQRRVTLLRPARPRDWMSREEFLGFPKELEVRLVEIITREQDRPTGFTVVTTLLDAEAEDADWIRDLYRSRWLVELDINAIKTVMGLKRLRCKSPAMVETEIWCGLLAYNLLRLKIQMAVAVESADPVKADGAEQETLAAPARAARTCSFTKTMQLVAAQWGPLAERSATPAMVRASRRCVLRGQVGHRPGRWDPRAVKWRPKVLALLMVPRWILKERWEARHAA